MEIDERFMRRALQLARLGQGAVSPNPMVGAVIVHDGQIIGEGYHRQWGGPHAEVNAVNSVADKRLLPLSTMYVTLEPCSHYGKTPPCAEMLVRERIPRVVVGITDPFARVSGRGVRMLRDAGAEVVTGVLADECLALNRRFITAHTCRRPYIMLKWAQSADGYMGREGEKVVFSTDVTMMWMHRERSRCDAILVGAGTVAADDSMPLGSRLLTDGLPTLIYNNVKDGKEGSVEYVRIDTSSPMAWLADLYGRGITSLMVEGGACVLDGLLGAGMWDEARIETAATVLGGGITAPAVPRGIVVASEWHGANSITTLVNDVKTCIEV